MDARDLLSLPVRLVRYASAFHVVACEFLLDPFLLAAICDRESGGGIYLTPKGPEGTGDGGNGLGLMQIDRRYHGKWAAQVDERGVPLWKIPLHNIRKGGEILRGNLDLFGNDVPAAIASYNCSAAHIRRARSLMSPEATLEQRIHAFDAFTTGRNYVFDVLHRHAVFSSRVSPV